MFEAKAEAEAKALRPRPTPRPKFWPRDHFGLRPFKTVPLACSALVATYRIEATAK